MNEPFYRLRTLPISFVSREVWWKSTAPARAKLVGPDGSQIDIPADLYDVLRDIVSALSQAMAISIAPHNTLLTTQEAADLLNISRRHWSACSPTAKFRTPCAAGIAASCCATSSTTPSAPGQNVAAPALVCPGHRRFRG